jgi:hypothetical protein
MLSTHLHLHVALQQDKWAKRGNLPKGNGLSKIEEQWIERELYFVFVFKWFMLTVSWVLFVLTFRKHASYI